MNETLVQEGVTEIVLLAKSHRNEERTTNITMNEGATKRRGKSCRLKG